MNRSFGWALFTILLLGSRFLAAQAIEIANPSFEKGTVQSADGWTLSSAEGGTSETQSFHGTRSLWIKGDGKKGRSSWWQSPQLTLAPGKLYLLTFQARRDNHAPGGCAISGTTQFNVDLDNLNENWQRFQQVFVASHRDGRQRLRFGLWESKDRFTFDAVRLVPVLPMHRRIGNVELGSGERIIKNSYNFAPPMAETHSNYFRPLRYSDCHFNTNRCIFDNNSKLEFEHTIAEHPIQSAKLFLWNKRDGVATLFVQVSRNRGPWISLGEAEEGQKKSVALPDSLFPAKSLAVRLSATTKRGATIILSGYRLEAVLNGAPLNAAGETRFMQVERAEPGVEAVLDCPGLFDPSQAKGGITLKLVKGSKELTGEVRALDNGNEYCQGKLGKPFDAPAGSGHHDLVLESQAAKLVIPFDIPEYYSTSYGELLDASGVWWASSGWKIPPNRELPKKEARGLYIELARNEAEAVQLVMRPTFPITDFRITVSAFKNEAGAILASESIQILRVAYVPVALPTDNTGVAALWPDPLPPIPNSMTLAADTNQPFWIRVKTSSNTAPGLYQGSFQLLGRNYQKSIPCTVRVFKFSLPERMTCTSALGFNAACAFQYHGVITDSDKRKVLNLYLQALSDHHISPYNAAPLDPFKVIWPTLKPGDHPQPDDLKVRIDWTQWDHAMQKAFEKYHFNTFNLPIEGMGGGTFYSRTEPSLLGFGKESPVFKTLFKNYVQAIEQHLHQRGWLQDAYVYWFDEPDPKDYAFVMNGFDRIKAAAPGIPRMLTEEIQPELIGGPTIWCPISPALKAEDTRERQKCGEKIWWYVCTGPKAPYATLFIDHPATELRVWLWQTWQRDVQGILIWETLLWTSPLAYPDPHAPQNPYEDPMGWEYGYGGEPGMHRPWGNGDGRFLYPPLAAADGRPAAPIFEPPVDCIRLEMLRDGIEDYEYLAMLRRALASKGNSLSVAQRSAFEQLLQVPTEITESMTQFTKDPAPIEAHRRQVAEALENL